LCLAGIEGAQVITFFASLLFAAFIAWLWWPL
jgi:hypothetical protein